jgi:hypothetical protein
MCGVGSVLCADRGSKVAPIHKVAGRWRSFDTPMPKVLPVCKNVADACNNDFERHHHDETTDDAMALCVNFGAQLKDLKQNAVDGVWDALGDWKYQLIEIGIKDDFDRYIAAKFDPVFEILDKNAREQMAYCAARISGHITDEMHAMTPDELKDFVARRDAGTSRR